MSDMSSISSSKSYSSSSESESSDKLTVSLGSNYESFLILPGFAFYFSQLAVLKEELAVSEGAVCST